MKSKSIRQIELTKIVTETIYRSKKTGQIYRLHPTENKIDLLNPIKRNMDEYTRIGENTSFEVFKKSQRVPA